MLFNQRGFHHVQAGDARICGGWFLRCVGAQPALNGQMPGGKLSTQGSEVQDFGCRNLGILVFGWPNTCQLSEKHTWVFHSVRNDCSSGKNHVFGPNGNYFRLLAFLMFAHFRVNQNLKRRNLWPERRNLPAKRRMYLPVTSWKHSKRFVFVFLPAKERSFYQAALFRETSLILHAGSSRCFYKRLIQRIPGSNQFGAQGGPRLPGRHGRSDAHRLYLLPQRDQHKCRSGSLTVALQGQGFEFGSWVKGARAPQ